MSLWPGIVGDGPAPDAIDGSLYLAAELRPGQVPRTVEERGVILDRLFNISSELGRRLEVEPEVAGVTFASALPGMLHRDYRIEIDGRDQGRNARTAPVAWVDAGFFDVLGIPLLSGRSFEAGDIAGVDSPLPVAIINRSFSKEWFGDKDPIGQRVRIVGPKHPDDPWSEIVGVVGDVGMSLTDGARPRGLYLPLSTGTYPLRMAIHVRTSPTSFSSRLRSVSASVDPRLRVGPVRVFGAILDGARARQRTIYSAVSLATFAVLALSLCAIYAVVSFLVTQRRREIGIRTALGGRPSRVVLEILSRALAQIGAGVALGIALMLLFRVVTMASVSWGSLMEVAAATVGVGLLACVVPAVRAANVHPTEAIRADT
jgi:hypothetical protein